MKKVYGMVGVLSLVLGCALVVAAQQDKAKRPSPPAQAKWDLGDGKSVTLDYGSPRVKGRKIYGELVPFGQVWRTGANEATALVTPVDLTLGGTTVPAGSYTIFTVPNKDKWMKVSTLPSAVENFTVSFEKAGSGANLNIDWETTRASVMVSKK